MTAEGNGTQVVFLLDRVVLAIETIVLYLTVLNHLLRAGRRPVEAVVSEVRAEVDPGVIGLSCLFVLQFDMVEVIIVHIKSVDTNRHVVALFVTRREGIQYPLVGRHGDIHRTGNGHIVYGQARLLIGGKRHTLGFENEANIFVVVRLSRLHLDGLNDRLVAVEDELPSVAQRHSVHTDLGAIRIGSVIESESKGYAYAVRHTHGFVGFVPHSDGEACRLVVRHIACLMTVEGYLRVLYLLSSHIKRRAGIIEIGGVRALPRANGGTTQGVVHKGTEEIFILVVRVKVARGVAECFRVVVEHIHLALIHIECKMLERSRSDCITGGLHVLLSQTVLRQVTRRHVYDRIDMEVYFRFAHFGLQVLPEVFSTAGGFVCLLQMFLQRGHGLRAEQALELPYDEAAGTAALHTGLAVNKRVAHIGRAELGIGVALRI